MKETEDSRVKFSLDIWCENRTATKLSSAPQWVGYNISNRKAIPLYQFIKIFQNTPQLCWGDEWPTLSPGACLREAASAKAGERACPVE